MLCLPKTEGGWGCLRELRGFMHMFLCPQEQCGQRHKLLQPVVGPQQWRGLEAEGCVMLTLVPVSCAGLG